MHHTPPSLRRTLAVQIGLMIAGLLLVGAGGAWGVRALHADFGAALNGYQELHDVYEVGYHVTTAKLALQDPHPDADKALSEARAALTTFERYSASNAWLPESMNEAAQLHAALREAAASLEAPAAEGRNSVSLASAAALDRALGHLVRLSNDVQNSIAERQKSADAKRKFTLIFVLALCGVVTIGAILLGVRQYRSVVRPLDRLGAGVRQLAARQFAGRIDTGSNTASVRGSREFTALAEDFNRMAEALDHFYRELESQVRIKSRELVRSERLASIGYLAAGVAHEINNPLGIIAGYAESMLQDLKELAGIEADAEAARKAGRTASPADDSETGLTRADVEKTVEKTLRIISEEAFRCKRITDRLLSLSRTGSEEHKPVNLGRLVRDVISNLEGLGNLGGRRMTLEIGRTSSAAAASSSDDPTLLAPIKEGEIKQVVLNLALNALGAVQNLPPAEGHIRVAVKRVTRRDAGGVREVIELSVADNGRGMTPAVLERVFEPFFTDAGPQPETSTDPSARAGTGLGLSITHAIVADHGGAIRAASDGPGRGSCFTVTLPAAG